MTMRALFLVLAAGFALAQPPGGGGFGGPPQQSERKILKEFDKNSDGWLNAEERKPAREAAKRPALGGRGGPRGGMGRGESGKPGPHVEPGEVTNYPDKPLYEPGILRTVFLTFENSDWEKELEDFHGTDVDVPCTMVVDGKTYKNVGVHFRGMSSYMMVPAGSKRSLNISMDLADKKQKLYGSKTLNLLNCHEDDSCLSSVLYSHIARQYIPAPKANMVKVVINGESWGIYSNVQQFDKLFLDENYKTTKGTRWKVRGSPQGRGGLEYFGDKVEDYKRYFEIKTDDDPKAWAALINLCKVLKETPADKLEAALAPIVDIDNLLWFLALDVALVNNDGYWTRASDYSIYLDGKGKFHFVPHDMNEAFHEGGGPGGGMRGPGGGGIMGGPMGGPVGLVRMPMPTPGEVLPPPLREIMQMTDEQKQKLDALQKDVDEKLAAILTDAQKKQLKELKDRPMGGMGGGGVKLDPLAAMNEDRKPLRSKVLAVPSLKAKYLANVKTIAEKSLDWKTLGPVVQNYRGLLEKEIEKDTRKLGSVEGFKRAMADDRGSLHSFADQRRAFLLSGK